MTILKESADISRSMLRHTFRMYVSCVMILLQSKRSEHPATWMLPLGKTLIDFVLYTSSYVSVIWLKNVVGLSFHSKPSNFEPLRRSLIDPSFSNAARSFLISISWMKFEIIVIVVIFIHDGLVLSGNLLLNSSSVSKYENVLLAMHVYFILDLKLQWQLCT